MYANEDYELKYEFTIEDIKELDERRTKCLSGESTTYTWQEAKELIIQKNNQRKA